MSTLIGSFVDKLTDGPAHPATKQSAALMHKNVEIPRTIGPMELEREISRFPRE